MANFFEEKGNLSFELNDIIFRKNNISYIPNETDYIGLVYGKPAHIRYDFNHVFIQFDDTRDLEAFYFYEDDLSKLLSHYYISSPKKGELEISNSNISYVGGKYILNATAGTWEQNMDRYLESQGAYMDLGEEAASFDELRQSDVLGRDLFEIDSKLTSMKGIVNDSIIGDKDIESDKPISLEFMLQYEALLGTRFSRARKEETNLR